MTGAGTGRRGGSASRNAVNKLCESGQMYRLFMENFQGIAFQSTLDLRPIFVHGAVEEIMGYPEEYFMSGSFDWSKIVFPEDRHGFRKTVKKMRSRLMDAHHWEFRIVRGDGQIRWVRATIQKIRGEPLLIQGTIYDITDLREADKMLEEQRIALEHKNIALREVLEQIEQEKKQIMDNVVANAENLLLPIIEKLRVKGVSPGFVDLMEKNLRELASSFGKRIGDRKSRLTPREIEISDMIRSGLTSKEIADLLNISLHTIEKQRLHIRQKMGITGKKVNLTSFLQAL